MENILKHCKGIITNSNQYGMLVSVIYPKNLASEYLLFKELEKQTIFFKSCKHRIIVLSIDLFKN